MGKGTRPMNGYKLMADSYRKALVNSDGYDTEKMKDNIRIFDMLSDLKETDKYIIFDSSMFNDVFKGYIDLIINELEEQYKNEELEKINALELIRSDIRQKANFVLDYYSSKQAEDYYYEK